MIIDENHAEMLFIKFLIFFYLDMFIYNIIRKLSIEIPNYIFF
jgi:hypothetical protein